MFCENCGADNSDAAKFCRKCGADLSGEIETRVASRRESSPPLATDHENESEIFAISPTLLFVKAGYVAAAVGALLLVALAGILLPASVPVWAAIPFALLLLLIPAFYHFKQKLTRYTLHDSKLEIDSGFISRTTRNVPLRRIQDVTVSESMTQRILGFGDLVIDNASEEGGKIVLKNINTPKRYADVLLKQMRRIEK